MSEPKRLITDDYRAKAAVFRAFALETIDAEIAAELLRLADDYVDRAAGCDPEVRRAAA